MSLSIKLSNKLPSKVKETSENLQLKAKHALIVKRKSFQLEKSTPELSSVLFLFYRTRRERIRLYSMQLRNERKATFLDEGIPLSHLSQSQSHPDPIRTPAVHLRCELSLSASKNHKPNCTKARRRHLLHGFLAYSLCLPPMTMLHPLLFCGSLSTLEPSPTVRFLYSVATFSLVQLPPFTPCREQVQSRYTRIRYEQVGSNENYMRRKQRQRKRKVEDYINLNINSMSQHITHVYSLHIPFALLYLYFVCALISHYVFYVYDMHYYYDTIRQFYIHQRLFPPYINFSPSKTNQFDFFRHNLCHFIFSYH